MVLPSEEDLDKGVQHALYTLRQEVCLATLRCASCVPVDTGAHAHRHFAASWAIHPSWRCLLWIRCAARCTRIKTVPVMWVLATTWMCRTQGEVGYYEADFFKLVNV